MSKVTDALRQAEAERAAKQEQANGATPFSGYLQALKEELREELRWVGQVVTRKSPEPASGQPPVPVVTPPSHESVSERRQTNGPPASWGQATALLEQELRECERQAAQRAEAQVRLAAQSAALDERLAQLEQERLAVRRLFEDAATAAVVLEAVKASLHTQVEAWRACQRLVHDVRLAMEEFQTQAAVVAQVAQSKPAPADAAVHYQRLSDHLRQHTSQLKTRLAQALAATDASAGRTGVAQ